MAKRLKDLSVPYTRIVQSSMTRAKNTASVISKHLPNVPVETCDFLREGAPIRPVPGSSNWRPEAQVSMMQEETRWLMESDVQLANNVCK